MTTQADQIPNGYTPLPGTHAHSDPLPQNVPAGRSGAQRMPSAEELTSMAKIQVRAMNEANLASADVFVELCAKLRDGLVKKGFTHSGALEIICAAVKK